MLVISLLTLIRVIVKTRNCAKDWAHVYAIVSLSVLAWFLISVESYASKIHLIYSLSQGFSYIQDVQIWLFAWTYFKGTRGATQPDEMSSREAFLWTLTNSFIVFAGTTTVLVFCVFTYMNQIHAGVYLQQVMTSFNVWYVTSDFILLYATSLILVSIYRLNARIKQFKRQSNLFSPSSYGIEVNLIATVGHVSLLAMLLLVQITIAFFQSQKNNL